MIHLRNSSLRPQGEFEIKLEGSIVAAGETTQCVHCGCHWTILRGSGRKRDYCSYHAGPTCGSPGCHPDRCEKKERGIQTTDHNYPSWFRREKAIRDAAALDWIRKNPGKVIVP